MAANQQLDTAIQMFRSMGERTQALATVVGMVEGFRIAIDEMGSQFQLDEDIRPERVGVGGVPAESISAIKSSMSLLTSVDHPLAPGSRG